MQRRHSYPAKSFVASRRSMPTAILFLLFIGTASAQFGFMNPFRGRRAQQLTTICSAQPSACDGTFTDTTLNLTSLQLGGTVPTELASLTNLVQLELWNNSLSGTVPTFLSALTALTHIDLDNNQLSGTIPTQYSQLTALKVLSLDGNLVSGTVPNELSSCVALEDLFLDHDDGTNRVSGTIPDALRRGEISWRLYS